MTNKIKKIVKTLVEQTTQDKNVFYHGSKYPKITHDVSKDNNFGRQLYGYGFYVSKNKEESIKYYALEDNTDGFLYTIYTESLNYVNWYDSVPQSLIDKIKDFPNFYKFFYETIDFSELNFDGINLDSNMYIVKHNGVKIIFDWDYVTDPIPEWLEKKGGSAGYFVTVFINNKVVKQVSGLKKENLLDAILSMKKLEIKNVERKSPLTINNVNLDNIKITKENLFSDFYNLYWYLFLHFDSTKRTSEFLATLGVDAIYGNESNINIINVKKIVDYKKQRVLYKP